MEVKAINDVQSLYCKKHQINQGLTVAFGDKTRNLKQSERLSRVCGFCLDPLVLPDKAISKYDCGHIYHTDCIQKYLIVINSDVCPYCRSKTKYIKNYKTVEEYFNFECIKCDDVTCYINKSAETKKIKFTEYKQEIRINNSSEIAPQDYYPEYSEGRFQDIMDRWADGDYYRIRIVPTQQTPMTFSNNTFARPLNDHSRWDINNGRDDNHGLYINTTFDEAIVNLITNIKQMIMHLDNQVSAGNRVQLNIDNQSIVDIITYIPQTIMNLYNRFSASDLISVSNRVQLKIDNQSIFIDIHNDANAIKEFIYNNGKHSNCTISFTLFSATDNSVIEEIEATINT